MVNPHEAQTIELHHDKTCLPGFLPGPVFSLGSVFQEFLGPSSYEFSKGPRAKVKCT